MLKMWHGESVRNQVLSKLRNQTLNYPSPFFRETALTSVSSQSQFTGRSKRFCIPTHSFCFGCLKFMSEAVIGHGTWYDKMSQKVVNRERKLGRSLEKVRTEMGLGASGFPHIGSLGDAARSYAVTLALKEMGFNSELVAFCDDKDGLRKVPTGLRSEERRVG